MGDGPKNNGATDSTRTSHSGYSGPGPDDKKRRADSLAHEVGSALQMRVAEQDKDAAQERRRSGSVSSSDDDENLIEDTAGMFQSL